MTYELPVRACLHRLKVEAKAEKMCEKKCENDQTKNDKHQRKFRLHFDPLWICWTQNNETHFNFLPSD